jgi:hypothetical protein
MVTVYATCEVEKAITPLHFPSQGQVPLQLGVTDDCPAEATRICLL